MGWRGGGAGIWRLALKTSSPSFKIYLGKEGKSKQQKQWGRRRRRTNIKEGGVLVDAKGSQSREWRCCATPANPTYGGGMGRGRGETGGGGGEARSVDSTSTYLRNRNGVI